MKIDISRSLSVVLAAGLAHSLCGLSGARAGDWPQFRGPMLDNVSPATGLVDKFLDGGPRIVWETKVAGGSIRDSDGAFASPVVAGGRVFAFGRNYERGGTNKPPRLAESPDILYCLDAKDGRMLWRHEFKPHAYYGEKTCWNTPVVDGDVVYARGPDGEQRAIGIKDGATLWTWPKDAAELEKYVKGVDDKGKDRKPITGYGISAPSVVVDDILIVPAWGGFRAKIFGLDKKTGEAKWETPEYPCWQFSAGCMVPMVFGGKKGVAIGNRVLDPATGKEIMAPDPERKGEFLKWGGSIEWVPGAAGNRLVVSGRKDLKIPKEEEEAAKRQFPKAWNFMDGVRCFEFSLTPDGVVEARQLWEFLEREGRSTKAYGGAAIVGELAYIFFGYGTGNRLVCFQMSDGRKLWDLDLKSPLGHANAIYADGKIYYLWSGMLTVIPVSAKGPGDVTSTQVLGAGWASPALVDGFLYVRDDFGTVKCVDLRKDQPVRLAAATFATADWPQADGPFGNGSAVDKGLTEQIPSNGLRTVWEAQTEPGAGVPVIAGGKVFLMGQKDFGLRKEKDGTFSKDKDGKPVRDMNGGFDNRGGPATLYCLDRATGKTLWRHAFSEPSTNLQEKYVAPCVTPLVRGDKVYALGGSNELVCLNAADGKLVWTAGSDAIGIGDYRLSPACRLLVIGDVVVASRGGAWQPNVLTALDKNTGAKRWSKYFATQNNNEYSPRVLKLAGGECLVEPCPIWLNVLAADSAPLCALQATSLPPVPDKDPAKPPQPQWDAFKTMHYTVGGNRLLVYRGAKSLDAFDVVQEGAIVTCKRAWSADLAGGRLIVGGDRFFELAGDRVTAISLADGKTAWTGQIRANPVGAIAADGKIILVTADPEVVLLKADGAEFKVLSRAKVPGLAGVWWSAPALSGGQLFLRDCAGTIKCLDLKAN